MYNGLLHLHSTLRWVVLIALLISIYKLFTQKDALKSSKTLLMSAHASLLVGLYQYIAGPLGLKMIQSAGIGATMKDAASRFWAVEHIFSMILAIVLITIGHVKYKKTLNPSPTRILYVIALILILLAMPWPFRAGIGRPWLPELNQNNDVKSSGKDCFGLGNEDCIKKIRSNFTSSGKQIVNESYLGDGVFKISSLDPSKGIIFNSTINTDCNCQITNLKISDIE